MDSKIFRYSGVGSKAWYISRIKIGHRYLEEHKSELEIKPEPKITGAAPTGVEHHVPQIPPFKPSIPAVPENDPEPISEPAPEISPVSEQRSDTSSGLKTDTPEEISPLENTNPPAGVMIVPKATPGTFLEQLRTIAGDLALEKYADQITVKDLMDHAEKWS